MSKEFLLTDLSESATVNSDYNPPDPGAEKEKTQLLRQGGRARFKMNDAKKDFLPYQDLLCDQEVIVFGLRIIQYFDAGGNMSYKYHHHGDVQSTQILGLLDEVKLDLQNYFRNKRS